MARSIGLDGFSRDIGLGGKDVKRYWFGLQGILGEVLRLSRGTGLGGNEYWFRLYGCLVLLSQVARVSGGIGSGSKGYWVRQQGLLGLVTRESLGIRSGGKGSKSGDNLGMSQNFMYVATCILSCAQGSGFQSLFIQWMKIFPRRFFKTFLEST